MRKRFSLAFAGLAAVLVHAIPNAVPEPTLASENVYNAFGWTPAPTEAPSLELLKRGVGLVRRDLTSGELIGYFAPDTMCGYISGSIGASLPCSTASKCAAIAPLGGFPGAVGCCASSGADCDFITTCYDYAAYTSSKCDHACQQDKDVKICSNSATPYCYGYTWPDISATLWECDTTSAFTMDTVLFTFNGETDGRSWTAEYYSGASASSLGGILTITSSLVLSSSSSASSGTSTSPGSTTEPAKSTNVGPIVGGVVGGLAVIGATACGVIFLLLRKRKRKNDLAAAASGTPGEAGPPTVYPQYNPNTGAAGGVDAGGAAGYYNHDNKAQMAQMPPYPQTPGNQYPGGGQQQKYEPSSPYQDNNRVSTFSEAPHSYVLPYQPSMHQVPMELDASSSVPHHGQGQPIYEAPTSNN